MLIATCIGLVIQFPFGPVRETTEPWRHREGDLGDVGTIRVHSEDLQVARNPAMEHDFVPPWRPGRLSVLTCELSKSDRLSSVGVHHVNLRVTVAITLKGD